MRSTETKVCVRCGREFGWRPKWERHWEQVRYCSQRCRTARLRRIDETLEAEIRSLLATRSSTICPSEVARRIGGDDWRALMEPTRQAARRLVAKGQIEILQRGQVVDPSTAKGPIRLRSARTRARG